MLVILKAQNENRQYAPSAPQENYRTTNREPMKKERIITICEVLGSGLAMVYALLIASNTGNEILGFTLLLFSALLFAAWGLIDKRWAFLTLQFFYAASAIIGLVRWS